MNNITLSCLAGLIISIPALWYIEYYAPETQEYVMTNIHWVKNELPSCLYEWEDFSLYWKVPVGVKMFITVKYNVTRNLETGGEKWEIAK